MSTVHGPNSSHNDNTGENRRAAATIQVTICTMVMTAGLAIIAGEGAVTTFYLEHRTLQSWAAFALIAAAFAVVGSFVVGGRGLSDLSSGGYDGNWDIFKVSNAFNIQAILCLIAALLVVFGVAFGTRPIETKPQTSPQQMQDRLNRDEARLRIMQRQIETLKATTAKSRSTHF